MIVPDVCADATDDARQAAITPTNELHARRFTAAGASTRTGGQASK